MLSIGLLISWYPLEIIVIDNRNQNLYQLTLDQTITQGGNMDTKQKLLDFLGDTNFKFVNNGSSVEEFKDIVQYNQNQYDRIEAKGDHYRERILDLMTLILSETLQPVVLSRFGDTSNHSLRSILNDCFYTGEMKSEWEACKRTALAALGEDGLDERQLEIVSQTIDYLPETMINLLVWIVGRLKVVPMQEATNISRVLMKMMKEAGYDDNTGHN